MTGRRFDPNGAFYNPLSKAARLFQAANLLGLPRRSTGLGILPKRKTG